jgi:hypothetical protein
LVFVEVRNDFVDREGVTRKLQWRACADSARHGFHLRAIGGDQFGADAIVGAGASHISLDHLLASHFACTNAAMDTVDAGFLQLKRRGVGRRDHVVKQDKNAGQ